MEQNAYCIYSILRRGSPPLFNMRGRSPHLAIKYGEGGRRQMLWLRLQALPGARAISQSCCPLATSLPPLHPAISPLQPLPPICHPTQPQLPATYVCSTVAESVRAAAWGTKHSPIPTP